MEICILVRELAELSCYDGCFSICIFKELWPSLSSPSTSAGSQPGAAMAGWGRQVEVELPPWAAPKRGWARSTKAQPRGRTISGGVTKVGGQDQHLHLVFASCQALQVSKGNTNWGGAQPIDQPWLCVCSVCTGLSFTVIYNFNSFK